MGIRGLILGVLAAGGLLLSTCNTQTISEPIYEVQPDVVAPVLDWVAVDAAQIAGLWEGDREAFAQVDKSGHIVVFVPSFDRVFECTPGAICDFQLFLHGVDYNVLLVQVCGLDLILYPTPSGDPFDG